MTPGEIRDSAMKKLEDDAYAAIFEGADVLINGTSMDAQFKKVEELEARIKQQEEELAYLKVLLKKKDENPIAKLRKEVKEFELRDKVIVMEEYKKINLISDPNVNDGMMYVVSPRTFTTATATTPLSMTMPISAKLEWMY